MNTPGLTTDDLAGRTPGGGEQATPYPDEPGSRADAVQGSADPTTPYPDESGAVHGGAAPVAERDVPVVDDSTADAFSQRWTDVQARFVDDPRAAVRDADALVAELMQTLAERFAQHKGGLEDQWNQGGEPDTESLRLALQQYRSFFDRLLST